MQKLFFVIDMHMQNMQNNIRNFLTKVYKYGNNSKK